MGNKGGRPRPPPKPGRPAPPPKPTDGRCTWQPFYYLEANRDLQNAFGWDYHQVRNHWINHGHREGRSPCGAIQPGCKWDGERYLKLNPDVRGKMDPFHHVRNHGLNEGRAICWPTRENQIRQEEAQRAAEAQRRAAAAAAEARQKAAAAAAAELRRQEAIRQEENRKRQAEEAEAERLANAWMDQVHRRQVEVATRFGPEESTVDTSKQEEKCMFHWEDYHNFYPDVLKNNKSSSQLTDDEKNRLKAHWTITGIEEGRTPCGAKMPGCVFQPNDYFQQYTDIQGMINKGEVSGTTREDKVVDHYRRFGIHENRILCSQSPEPNLRHNKKIWGCETGQTDIKLSCPAGSVIHPDGYILYGRWDNTICPSLDKTGKVAKHGGITSRTSFVRRRYPLPKRCHAARECTLSKIMSENTNNDPVPNTYKHYEIYYRCGR